MISIYDSAETNFNHNGIVVLSDTLSCPVTEELNGAYGLTLEYPIDTRGKWQHLLEGNIIKADGQLFRIYRKVKVLNAIKVNARHIFFDLLDNFLEDVRPTNLSGSAALDWILAHTQYPHPFVSMSDVGGYDTRYFIRKNLVEAILGDEGIIATWGGELVRDNFIIKLLEARGLDRGVLIAYGKNIQGIEETLDTDGICTRLMPIGRDGLLLPEKYIDSQYIDNYPHPKIKKQEFDIGPEETLGITEEMAIELLREAGTNYMLNGKIDVPDFNYRIDFLELSKTIEYKDYAPLERVYLGDTVTVRHSRLNIDLKAKVIKITKNVLTNRLEKVELGSFKPNIATSTNKEIQNVKKDITQTKSSFQKAVESVTALLASALGGYVVKKPGEILIMDTEDEATAEKVWRWNLNGLGYSGTGIDGPYETAITMDGHIVAGFISGLLGEFVELRASQIILGDDNTGISDDLISSAGDWNDASVVAYQAASDAANAVQKDFGYNNAYITENGLQVKDLIGGEVVTTGNPAPGIYGTRVKKPDGSEVVDLGKFGDDLYGLQAKHEDGSYTRLTSAGLQRLVAGEAKPYQYDTYLLMASTKGLGVGWIDRDWTSEEEDAAKQVWYNGMYVNLPQRFWGKDFQCFLSISAMDIPQGASSGCYVKLEIDSINKALGRIHVVAYNTAYYAADGWVFNGIDFLVTTIL
ncbi:MAG TPA: hypothetical protein DEF42_03650 [Desulfosporosinus sp.]|nr:hypothetical protein [Desulfosporosinus sp.]